MVGRRIESRVLNGLLRSGWLLVVILLLWGCAEPWKAPVDRRSSAGRGEPITGDVYRVRSGDTLYGIAWRAGADYRQLAQWNGIGRPYTIYVGQKIKLKPGPRQASKPPSGGPSKAQAVKTPPAGTGTAKTSSSKQASATAEPSSRPVSSGKLKWEWPTQGRVSQGFSAGDPARKGIKIAGQRGQSVVAAEAGEVVYSGSGLVGYGELIIIKHNNEYLSAYGHNDKRLVQERDRVARGDVIARMGMAGGQPVLHFEIRRRGKPVNPTGLLPRR